MKKLMLGLAVAAVGSAFAVESSNIVGYNTISCAANKYYMLAVDFQSTGASTKTMLLKDFLKGDYVGATTDTDCPEIQIWDPAAMGGLGGYTHYYFWSASKPKGYSNFWAESAAKSGWEAAQAITINCGQSVWFRSPTDCTITVAGQVVAVDTTITTVAGKYNMIANPFPVALKLNDDSVNWVEAGLVGATVNTSCPEIQVWDPAAASGLGGYTHYFFWSESKPKGYTNFWGATASKSNYDADLAIPVGSGFWLKYSGESNLTFTFKR